MEPILYEIIQSVVFATIVFIFMWLAKKIADYNVKNIYNADHEIETAENMAVAFRRVGLYLAISIAMFGAINTNMKSYGITTQLIDGSLILVFLSIAMLINDKILLGAIDNSKALKEKNISVGITEMGNYIATGLIAYGSFVDIGPWYSSIVFFVLGQIMLVAMVKVYEYFSSYDALNEIQNGNVPAGLMISGTMIAYGLILKAAIAGPFISWSIDLQNFAISAFSGIIMLIIANLIIDKVFLPNTTVYKEIKIDKDIPPIMVAVAVKIAVAIIIGAVIL